MKGKDIRKNWLKFFGEEHSHLEQRSASLIPDNPTLLLTNAGMVPFVPYFLGLKDSPKNRLVSVQKCVRVGGKDSDLENIGKTPRHLTFFEMLGNFSFGDYFKDEVIVWAWDLLTRVYKFDPASLSVSVFAGDERVPCDEEALKIWQKKVGVPLERIVKMGKKDNFWGPPGGISGPCGPCTEIYYHPEDGSEPLEIWNLVFMEYEQFEDGSMKPLKRKNVDTGLGLERLASILQKKKNVFQTDLLEPIVKKINFITSSSSNNDELPRKIIADHARCVSMLIADGITPSNLGRGYILRMLIRRAARFGRLLDLKKPFLGDLLSPVKEILGEAYPELEDKSKLIIETLQKEEEAFAKTIETGLRKINEDYSFGQSMTGEEAFDLYSTYGFPIELTLDIAQERGISVNLEEYEKAKDAHSEVSGKSKKFSVGFKSASASSSSSENSPTEFVGYDTEELDSAKVLGILDSKILILDKTPFYAESGGQISDTGVISSQDNLIVFEVKDVQKNQAGVFLHTGEFKLKDKTKEFEINSLVKCSINKQRRAEIKKHHTATHLLQAALRKVVGESIQQTGSQVTESRARFDFSHSKALTDEEIKKIEILVNSWINEGLEVSSEIKSFDEACAEGALAFFSEKYGDSVRVLKVFAKEKELISIELCGGTHVKNTSEIGMAKIISESSVSAGNRRIEFSVGESLKQALFEKSEILDLICRELKVQETGLLEKLKELDEKIKELQKKEKSLEGEFAGLLAENLFSKLEQKTNCTYLFDVIKTNVNLKDLLDNLSNKLLLSLSVSEYILFLISLDGENIKYACKTNSKTFSARDLLAEFSSVVGGKGGGKNDFAQGGGGNPAKISEALNKIKIHTQQ